MEAEGEVGEEVEGEVVGEEEGQNFVLVNLWLDLLAIVDR